MLRTELKIIIYMYLRCSFFAGAFLCFLTVFAFNGTEGLGNGHNDPNATNWRTYVNGIDEFSADLYKV